MKEKVMFQNLLKKRTAQFVKMTKAVQKNGPHKQLSEAQQAGLALKECLQVFKTCFPKPVLEQADQLLQNMTDLLEGVREETVSLQLAKHFLPDGKGKQVKESAGNLVGEIEVLLSYSARDVLKQLKKIQADKIGKAVIKNFECGEFGGLPALLKLLNGKREALFNQVVKMIRTSQKQDLDDLWAATGTFCHALSLATECGHQKGKRLLNILKVLHLKLGDVHDKEIFRNFIEDLSRERSRDSERAVDVQRIRLILNQLGIAEANAIQDLHSHLPLTLQVLKRQLVWRDMPSASE